MINGWPNETRNLVVVVVVVVVVVMVFAMMIIFYYFSTANMLRVTLMSEFFLLLFRFKIKKTIRQTKWTKIYRTKNENPVGFMFTILSNGKKTDGGMK